MANNDIVLTVSERETRNGIFDVHIEERYLLFFRLAIHRRVPRPVGTGL